MLRTFEVADPSKWFALAAGLNETNFAGALPNNQSPSENIPVGAFDWKYASSAITSAADKNSEELRPSGDAHDRRFIPYAEADQAASPDGRRRA
jgi:hypothetical protein